MIRLHTRSGPVELVRSPGRYGAGYAGACDGRALDFRERGAHWVAFVDRRRLGLYGSLAEAVEVAARRAAR